MRAAAGIAAGFLFLRGYAEGVAIWLLALGIGLDWLDGWVARRSNQESTLGEFLDPAADKVIMAVVYTLIGLKSGSDVVWLLIGAIAIRDAAVTAARFKDYAARGSSGPADPVAKFKTSIQSVGGVGALFYAYYVDADWMKVPRNPLALLVVVAALSYVSWYRYAMAGRTRTGTGSVATESKSNE
jgi:phosphatidylglycerophosphate synthase